MTLDEVEASLDVEAGAASVFVALCSLCWDNVAVAIRDRADELFFCKVRRSYDADYSDLYAARTASAPQPAA